MKRNIFGKFAVMIFTAMLVACGGGGSDTVPASVTVTIACPNGISTTAATLGLANAQCAAPAILSVSPVNGVISVSVDTFASVEVTTDSTLDAASITTANITLKAGLNAGTGTVAAVGTNAFKFTPTGKLNYGQQYTFSASVKDALGRTLLVSSTFTMASIFCVAPQIPNSAGGACIAPVAAPIVPVIKTCVDKEVIGIVAFRGEGLAFLPQIDGFALMMAPLANGPHTQEELRAVAQDFFTAHPYAYGGFTPNFHFSAEGAGLALFDWSPNDFGGVALVDKSGASVVFAGHVVWMGSGDILYPGLWSDSNGIVYSDAAAVAPMPSEFVSLSDWNRPIIYDPASGSRALTLAETAAFSDASFAMLRKTDLLHGFSACGNYSVASYVYTPAVGLTQAKPARQLYIVRGRTTQHWQPSR